MRAFLLMAVLGANAVFAAPKLDSDLATLDSETANVNEVETAQAGIPLNIEPEAAPNAPVRQAAPAPSQQGDLNINVTPQEITKWQQYFDLVIVVDKGSSAETIQVFKKGLAQPFLSSRVSTGTEQYTCHAVRDRQTGFVTSVRKIYTETPAGYYPAGYLDIDHFSGAFDDAHMPYAVFMNDRTGVADGVATHQAPPGTDKFIGYRASHGCMRLHIADAKTVFKSVLMTGGPVDLNGEGFNAKCNPAITDPSQCPQDVASRETAYHNFLLQSGVIGNTYPNRPLVPVVNRNGTLSDGHGNSFTLDTVNGRAKMVPGYKTLYIIENVETGTPTDLLVVGFDKKGKPITRPAQKTDITCPTPDQINQQEGRTPPSENNGWHHFWPWDPQDQPAKPGQQGGQQQQPQQGFDCHKGIFGCILGG